MSENRDPASTCHWRIEPGQLRAAAAIRRRDPTAFRLAALTFSFRAA